MVDEVDGGAGGEEVAGPDEPAFADGRRFRAAGVAPPRSRELAISLIALLEGAFVLGRAMRSAEPVLAAGRSAVAEVERALRDAGRSRRGR